MNDWNGKSIEIAKSKGGTLALCNPFRNLIQTKIEPFPPPEIVQKLYKSRQQRAFQDKDLELATKKLGFYSDIQSIHSEDAITWSVFGPLVHSEENTKKKYLTNLLDFLDVQVPIKGQVLFWLWRRVPHPDTLVSGGPEVDFGIQTNDILILGEAKWLSKIGTAQGKGKNRNQIELRQDFCKKHGRKLFKPISNFVILGASLFGDMVKNDNGDGNVYTRDITWKSLCELQAHPCFDEVNRYLEWKKEHSKI